MMGEEKCRVIACFLVFLSVAVTFQCLVWFSVASLERLRTSDRQREAFFFQNFVRNPNDLSSIVRQVKRACRRSTSQRFWIRPGRTSLWWDNIRNGTSLEEEYKENFRMCKANFQKLCSELRPFITQHKTNMRAPIDVETQVAVYLFTLFTSVMRDVFGRQPTHLGFQDRQ